MTILEIIKQPWPWYVAGPIIGLIVPALLILGNKHFGISANLRHACAACFPANISFFKYNWKKEVWNLLFVVGIIAGAVISTIWLRNPQHIVVNPKLVEELATYGIADYGNLIPTDIFSIESLLTLRGFLMMVGGGFIVGFGARYAGGCTSGHSIMGLSNLQWPSLIATLSFMAGGFLMANFLLPLILSL